MSNLHDRDIIHKNKPGRGVLTAQVNETGLRLFGDDFGVVMLRFLPYINHLLLNNGKLDPRKINADERAIWMRWKEQGFVAGGASDASGPVCVTREFYDKMNEILWLAYANWHNQPGAEA